MMDKFYTFFNKMSVVLVTKHTEKNNLVVMERMYILDLQSDSFKMYNGNENTNIVKMFQLMIDAKNDLKRDIDSDYIANRYTPANKIYKQSVTSYLKLIKKTANLMDKKFYEKELLMQEV